MLYRELKNSAISCMCRRCINKRYSLRLDSEDCYYQMYPSRCECCGLARNIVVDVRPVMRWKLWFRGKGRCN